MFRLALYFLGPPRVYLDGSIVEIRRRKVLALLSYLAVTAQRHSRDELAELLFSEQDREHARANIRQTLSFLGSAIGEERLGADRHSVWLLSGSGLWIDVAEFRHLLERGRAADKNSDLSTAQGHLGKAAELFRGEFLSGFFLKHNVTFEEWQLGEQESLRREQASALQRLVDIHGARGQYEQAIDLARRWLALDPLEEAIHRQLMRLYSQAGQHFEALRQYERCRSALDLELGEKPGEETEQLREHIASGKLLPEEERAHERGTQVHRGVPLFLFAQVTDLREEEACRQEARLREAIVAAHGKILGMAGRMLCAVFAAPQAAVEAALAAQSGLQSAGGVRAVLLPGKSHLQDETPPLALVERAKMLLEASHPGLVLLSEAAARLTRGAGLPEGVTLRCLGTHRLKDLGPAQTLHQVEHPALPRELPSLKTLDDQPNNLQTQPTPFIGREEELAAVEEALQPEDARLLTLTGAAGTGKTRLALQAAAALAGSLEQGVFFVDLSGLREPTQLIEAIAAVLELREIGGDDRSLLETLQDYLREKRLLLLLDNFEHLLSAAPLVAQLLACCPRLKVLATSREALHLRSERLFQVPPMRLPSQGQRAEVIKRCEAVRLFAERASAVRPDFQLSGKNVEAVAEICIRLDGLPLAIELAATHIRVLTPQALLARLKNRLDLLKEGPRDLPARQQTLRGEIDWSHELLGEDERRIFRRLSVFPGGYMPDAAEAACLMEGEDLNIPQGLSSLAEKNLVKLTDLNGEPRFRMLETIREYARERLAESGEVDAIEPRFADYFLQFVEQAEPKLYGPEQKLWLDRIEAEYVNIRAALGWLRDQGARADALRLAGALGWFWFRRGRFSEGQYWLELLRSHAGQDVPSGSRAKAAYYLGWMKLCAGSFWGNPEGKEFFRESLSLWRESGNRRGIALSQVWLGWETGVIEGAEAQALADDSVAIARETSDPWAISLCLRVAFSNLRRPDKNLNARRAALEEAIALARKVEDPFLLCQALTGMGNVFAWVGELEEAEPWYRDALGTARQIGDTWSILDSMNCLADVYLGLGQTREAKELFDEGLRLAMEQAARGYLGWFIGGLYGVAKKEGRLKRAAVLGSASESILNPGRSYNPHYAEELGLDEEVARAEWAAGQAMTVEQAVAYALSDE
jgi:predicted ATPase/DNA-binding SARP family transcriptional activator